MMENALFRRVQRCGPCAGSTEFRSAGLVISGIWRSRRLSAAAMAALLLATPHLLAQEAPLKVVVDDVAYSVSGTTVTGPAEQVDAAIAEKARFTARVLRQQILESEFSKQIYAPPYRAVIFSDDESGRLIERWRRSLRADSPAALAKAKAQFKQWASKLADDPDALMLAVARQDYRDGIGAYRENARIYRDVTKKGEPLSYDAALRLMRNAWPVIRLAYARGMEEQLGGKAAAANTQAQPAAVSADRLAQRIQSEVVSRVDSDIKEANDFDRIHATLRRIVEDDSAAAQAYRAGIKPPATRFAAYDPKFGSVRIGSVGQNAVKIAIPAPAATSPKLVDITGGILPSPYPISRPAPTANAGQAASPSSPAAGPANGNNAAAGAGGNQSPAGIAAGNVTNGGAADSGAANTASGSASASNDSPPVDPGSTENLKTFSSKGYHNSSGWAFNPMTGMWQNPNDPSQSENPNIITCCDDTGLAFPSDAVEAQEDYAWNEAGVDPNCGRLYVCGAGSATPTTAGADPNPDAPKGPTDKDQEILQAFDFIDKNLPPEKKRRADAEVMNALPAAYRARGVQLFQKFKAAHPIYPSHQVSAAAGPMVSRTSAPMQFSGQNAANQSTITGIGGVSSSYEPATKVMAQNIVGKYGTVPGGVSLDGTSPDLSFVKSAVFIAKANAVIINDDLVYVSPASARDFVEIAKAIAADDRIGVSLGATGPEVFGALPPNSAVAGNLELVDGFIAQIGYGHLGWHGLNQPINGYNWTNTHSAYAVQKLYNSNIFFTFHEFRFREDGYGELRRSNMRLTSTLIPIANENPGKKRLPDYGRIERHDVSSSVVANIKDLDDNFFYYARERIIRTSIGYGEVAAFARSMKAQGVKLEVR